MFINFKSILPIFLLSSAVRAVVESAAAGTCDNFCQIWYSLNVDEDICNFLSASLNNYAACGNCEILGSSDSQSYWADLWNAEISSWGLICPSEQDTTIGSVVFGADGVESISDTTPATVPSITNTVTASSTLTGSTTTTTTSAPTDTAAPQSSNSTRMTTMTTSSSTRNITTISGSNTTTSDAKSKVSINVLLSLPAVIAVALVV